MLADAPGMLKHQEARGPAHLLDDKLELAGIRRKRPVRLGSPHIPIQHAVLPGVAAMTNFQLSSRSPRSKPLSRMSYTISGL